LEAEDPVTDEAEDRRHGRRVHRDANRIERIGAGSHPVKCGGDKHPEGQVMEPPPGLLPDVFAYVEARRDADEAVHAHDAERDRGGSPRCRSRDGDVSQRELDVVVGDQRDDVDQRCQDGPQGERLVDVGQGLGRNGTTKELGRHQETPDAGARQQGIGNEAG
jgi:hypothetical protein